MVVVVNHVVNVQVLKHVSMVNVQEHLQLHVMEEFVEVIVLVEVVVLVLLDKDAEKDNVNVFMIVMKEIVVMQFKNLVLIQQCALLGYVELVQVVLHVVLMDFVQLSHLVLLL